MSYIQYALCFPHYQQGLHSLQCSQGWMAEFWWTWCKLVTACGRAEQETPLASEIAAFHCHGRHAVMRARLASVWWLEFWELWIGTVNNTSTFASSLSFQECNIVSSIQMSNFQNVESRLDNVTKPPGRVIGARKAIYMHHNPTRQVTYINAEQTINGDLLPCLQKPGCLVRQPLHECLEAVGWDQAGCAPPCPKLQWYAVLSMW